jgi:hypothetical protein
VALKDFTVYAKATTERIANNARKLVTDAGRPVISFDYVKTRNRTQHKDDPAKSIAERDGVTEGGRRRLSASGSAALAYERRGSGHGQR